MKNLLPHLFQTIASEAMFGIVVFDKSGQCLYSNKMADQMFGAKDLKLSDLTPTTPHNHFKSLTEELLKNDGFYQDILVRKADNMSMVTNVGIRFIDVDGHTAHLLMLQDVTLQKKLQREIMAKQNEIHSAYEELLHQNQQLKNLDIAKDRFIAITTHELRTPLSAMVASAEILKLGLYDNDEQMKEFISMIHEQGLHLQDLVNDILDFAKIQAGKMDFYIELQDVVELTRSIAESFKDMADQNGIKIAMATPTSEFKCYFDEVRLRQVLSNIINNAIKYNRAGGTVTIEFKQTDAAVQVFVRDTGKGIPQDQFDKVFNEFETVGQVAQHHKGTGLGMPISRKLTEGMGGQLLLESEVGVGSTFWVEIPKEKVLAPELYRPRPEKLGGDLAA